MGVSSSVRGSVSVISDLLDVILCRVFPGLNGGLRGELSVGECVGLSTFSMVRYGSFFSLETAWMKSENSSKGG